MVKRFLLIPLMVVLAGALIFGGCAAPAPAPAPVAPGPGPTPSPAPGPAAPAPTAEKPIEWRIALAMAPGVATKECEFWAEQMERRTNGRFKTKIFYHAQLGKDKGYPEGIKAGLYQMAQFTASFFPYDMPISNMLRLPGVAPLDMERCAELFFATYLDYQPFQEELAPWNMRPMFPMTFGNYELMGNKRIATVADLKGVLLRISGSKGVGYAAFGASIVYVPGYEVYEAVDRGTVEVVAFEWTNGYVRTRVYEVVKYATINTGVGGINNTVGCSWDAWNALPPDIQQISNEIVADMRANIIEVKGAIAQTKKDLALFEERGIEIIEFSAEDRAKLSEAGLSAHVDSINELEAMGKPAQEWYDWIMAKKTEIMSK